VPPLHIEFFFWKNTKISIFGRISKFLELIVYGQILADLGNFGQIWANFATLAMADSMPELRLKSLKSHNF
jgi:hypothetical protein